MRFNPAASVLIFAVSLTAPRRLWDRVHAVLRESPSETCCKYQGPECSCSWIESTSAQTPPTSGCGPRFNEFGHRPACRQAGKAAGGA